MPGIMLRYRRADAAASAGRLYDPMAAEFGRDTVLMDVDLIRSADHFGDITEQTLASAPVVLVIIGPRLLLVATLFKAQMGLFFAKTWLFVAGRPEGATQNALTRHHSVLAVLVRERGLVAVDAVLDTRGRGTGRDGVAPLTGAGAVQ